MNAILEQINSMGRVFVEFAGAMCLQSSVLIVILLLVDLVLRRRVRAVFRYFIWMLVLLKLVLPSSLSTPVSIGYWFGDELANVKVSDLAVFVEPADMPQAAEPAPVEVDSGAPAATPRETVGPAVSEAVSAAVTWQGVAFLVWLAVVIIMALLLLQRAIFVSGLVAQAKKADGPMNDAFEYCCERMGIKGRVGLRVSANATSPAVCGLFRPVVLVPENLGPKLEASQLRAVLMHELAHIKRGDLWANLAQTLLQIVYFYNPLLWLANCVIRRVREQAVDEMVQVAMGANARQYPQTLVNVAKLAFKRPALSLRLIGVVESKSALKGRIKRMLNRPIPKTTKLGVTGLLAVVITGAVLLPMAAAENGSQMTEDREQKIDDRVEKQFVAKLPNGVTVELVGVCEYPEGEPRCWQPDGSRMEKQIYVYRERGYSDGKYGFIVRVDGPDDLSFAWAGFEGGMGWWGSCTVLDSKGHKVEGYQAAVVKRYDGRETTNIRIGVADGPWRTIATHDGRSMCMKEGVAFSNAYESDGSVHIVVTDNLGRDVVQRIVAIDTDGNMHTWGGYYGSVSNRKMRQTTGSFRNLKLGQIKEFQFQVRPYDWIEFKNVSLKPNFKTDVQVEVGKGAAKEAKKDLLRVDKVNRRAADLRERAVERRRARAEKTEQVNQNPIGKWRSVDFVRNIEDFEAGEKGWTGDLYLKGLKFMKGGRTSGPWTWKKGELWHPGDRTKARYLIKEMEGSTYLFMEWMSGDVTIRGQKPRYYVMKKAGGKKKARKAAPDEVAKGPPLVVGSTPATFSDNVSPRLKTVRVKFDQPMMDGSWSWTGGGNTYPETTGEARYDRRKITCSLPVKLEPGKVYWVGINSPSYKNFKNPNFVPAERYVILFATRGVDGKPTPIPSDMLAKARRINAHAEIPYTQEMFNDIQPDGAILFKTTIRRINRSGREITTTGFINSDFVHVTDMSDGKGRPIKFTSTREEDIYRYKVTFNEPVLPGEVIEYSHEGKITGLVKRLPRKENEFQYRMTHWPAAGQPTLRIETYFLPESAQLISTTPEDMQRITKDGRIELHVEKIIPTGGSITTAFQYRLTGVEGIGGKDLEKGLIAYWDFDGNTEDKVGSNHGIVAGATLTDCIKGQAYLFDGKNDYIQTPLSIDQSGDKSVTISVWVYPTTIGGDRHQVISTDDGGHDWSIFSQGGKWHVFTGEYSWNSGFDVELNKWQHIAAVFKAGENIIFYKNGDSRSRGVAPATDVSTHNVCIGANPGPWSEYFKGRIDEVAIYERVLSSAEIHNIYQILVDSINAKLAKKTNVGVEVKGKGAGKKSGRLQVIEDEELNLSIAIPADWSCYKNPAPGRYKFSWQLLPSELKAWIMFIGSEGFSQANIPVRQIAIGDVAILKSHFDAYTVRPDSWAEYSISEIPAVNYVADYVDEGKAMVEYRSYLLGESMVYWFVFRIEKDKFEFNKDQFDSIVKSFKLKRDKKVKNSDVQVKAAIDSAYAWLKLVDDGAYGKSWEEAADLFKKAVSKEQLRSSLAAVRSPLGKVISREVKSRRYTKQVPGGPDGEYVVIQFDTSFENKKSAVETVTPMLDKDGVWRVSGYYIN